MIGMLEKFVDKETTLLWQHVMNKRHVEVFDKSSRFVDEYRLKQLDLLHLGPFKRTLL